MKDSMQPVSIKACAFTPSILHSTKGCVGMFIGMLMNIEGWRSFPLVSAPLVRLKEHYRHNFVQHAHNPGNYNIESNLYLKLAILNLQFAAGAGNFGRIVLFDHTNNIHPCVNIYEQGKLLEIWQL